MNILVTNDDGINSAGIYHLVQAMKAIGNVIVMAPLGEQSAVGHALTVTLPLRVHEFTKDGSFFGFAVDGTPADCVKLAMRTFLSEKGLPKPDVVVSGINHGRNTAVNIIYSGTVSAVTEATVLDCPGVAFSLASYNTEPQFDATAEFAKRFVPYVVERGLPRGTLLNVNAPPLTWDQIAGIEYTRQGSSFWEDTFERRLDPQNRPYYWLKGSYHLVEGETDCDDYALHQKMISVTPLHYDLTNHAFLEAMRNGWRIDF
jgi:5'-nucleotidase